MPFREKLIIRWFHSIFVINKHFPSSPSQFITLRCECTILFKFLCYIYVYVHCPIKPYEMCNNLFQIDSLDNIWRFAAIEMRSYLHLLIVKKFKILKISNNKLMMDSHFSGDSENVSRSRQKHNDSKIETNIEATRPESSKAESMSSTVSSRNFDIEYQKSSKEDMNPPTIFNNTGSSKYLHKKFKRIASTVIEDSCDKIKPNANGESTSDIGQLHMNEQCQERLTNNSNVIELNNREISVNCVHCQNPIVSVANVQNYGTMNDGNSFCAECFAVNSNISFSNIRKKSVQPSRSVSNETDSTDHSDKFKVDNSSNLIAASLLQQKTNKRYEHDSSCDENRVKTNSIHSIEPQNLKENLVKGVAFNYSVKELRANTISDQISANDNHSTSRHLCTLCQFSCSKIPILRKHVSRTHANQKPYSSNADGLIRSNFSRQCRYMIDMKIR